MILAAGFGTRLLPYSGFRPKPLFPLLNIPLLRLQINELRRAGIRRILVNCHHLSRQIEEAVADLDDLVVLKEKQILGTGGALRNALDHLEDGPLLVVNGDIYHTVDLRALIEQYVVCGSKVLLAVHDYPRFNSLEVEGESIVGFTAENCSPALAFTGLHVIDPQILKEMSKNSYSCIIDRYRQLLMNNERIAAVRVDECYWRDIGTPADYLDLHGCLLQQRVPCLPGLQAPISGSILVDEQARVGRGVHMEEWSCIGKAVIGNNVSIRRSVVWDGAVIADGTVLADVIVSQ